LKYKKASLASGHVNRLRRLADGET